MGTIAKRALALLGAGLLLIGSVAPAGAASGTVSVANLRGPLVNASFSSMDPTGCVETDTFVTANRPTDQQLPGRGTTDGVGGVDIWVYDWCTDTTLFQAFGETVSLAADEFQVSRQLDWAVLRTTMPATDFDTGETLQVSIDVAFAGTSDIYRNTANSNDRYPGGCHVLNRWKGSGRDASASGSVSVDGSNYATDVSQYAEIGYVIDGFEVIDCL